VSAVLIKRGSNTLVGGFFGSFSFLVVLIRKWINVLCADFHIANIKSAAFETTIGKTNANGVNGVTQWFPRRMPPGG